MSEEMVTVNTTVNGEPVTKTIPSAPPRGFHSHGTRLYRIASGVRARCLRRCSVRVDGDVARLPDAGRPGRRHRRDDHRGITDTGEIADLQDKFVEWNALQCGFCTPGMPMTAAELLSQKSEMSREHPRIHVGQLPSPHRLPRHR